MKHDKATNEYFLVLPEHPNILSRTITPGATEPDIADCVGELENLVVDN